MDKVRHDIPLDKSLHFDLLSLDIYGNLYLMDNETMLTVKEAAAEAKKSTKTIRRWLRDITKNDTHPSRANIFPSPADEKKIRQNKGRLVWTIDKSLILEQFKQEGSSEKQVPHSETARPEGENEVAFLRRQNGLLLVDLQAEREHNRKMEIEYNERQRESNVLAKGYQERLAIGAPSSKSKIVASSEDMNTVRAHFDSTDNNVVDAPDVEKSTTLKMFRRWTKFGPAISFDPKQSTIRFYFERGD